MEDMMPDIVEHVMLRGWIKELDALDERISGRILRAELRDQVQTYLRGLLCPAERKLVSNLELVPGYRVWNTKSAEPTFRALLNSDGATDVRFVSGRSGVSAIYEIVCVLLFPDIL
jgi:hypothetical protein